MANIFKAKTLVGRTGIFSHELIAPNLVYNTGNQTIEGIKDFNNIINVSGVKFDVLTTDQTPTHQEGVLYYSDDNKTLNLDLDVVDLKLLIGQENLLRAKNSTSSTMSAGTVVYIDGAQGNTPLVQRSIATGDSTSARTVGIAAHSINNNSKGYFTTFGLVEGVDTSAYSVGQVLYLSPQISGGLTGVKPQAPDHTVRIGEVINQGANGSIFVNIQNGFEIEELHNVRIINPQNKDGIVYNSASGLWLNIPVLTGNESLNQSLNELNINNIVYTTGNQTIDGLKNFTTIPTVNGTGVLLAGSPIPSTEASGAGGSIFITYVSPSGGIGNVGDYVYENIADGIGNTALISCSTTTQNVLVDIYALQGRTRFKPKLYIAGQEISSSLVVRQTDKPVFLVNDFGVNLNNATSLRVDHEDGAYYTISIAQDVAPQVLGAYFYGGYPGSQTELKAGDTFNFHVDTDIDVVSIEIDNFGAFNASTTSVTAGTSHNLTSRVIANRGTSMQALGARVRVQKANGSYSAWFLTTSQGSTDGQYTVKLNNLYPSVSVSTITYPVGQEALKDSEQATVSNTVSSFDVISYTSPNSDLTITNSSTYETTKTVTRSAGNYNISTNNFRITATRNANNAVTTNSSTVVKIAHTAPTLTVSVPAARLRTGGNDGTSAQSYTVTITATQQLLSAPTLSVPAGGGTLGSFGGSTTTWTATLSNINDNLTKGTYTWGAISATNLAGKVVTTISSGTTYVIGGFLSRTVSLAAFANEVNINTSVLDYTKMTLSWVIKSLPNKRAVGTTATPDPDSWTINSLSVNPTIVRILDTAATQSSSQATNVTVEETV